MPSVLATRRLSTRLKVVGCSTGMSAGLAPLRILSTTSAARLNNADMLGPIRHEAAALYEFLFAIQGR